MFKLLLTLFILLFISCDAAGQDPTRPLNGATMEPSAKSTDVKGDLVLQSIINASDKDNIKAIISGKLVAKGDMIHQFKVIDIEGKTVTLQASEYTRKLVLFSAPIVNYK